MEPYTLVAIVAIALFLTQKQLLVVCYRLGKMRFRLPSVVVLPSIEVPAYLHKLSAPVLPALEAHGFQPAFAAKRRLGHVEGLPALPCLVYFAAESGCYAELTPSVGDGRAPGFEVTLTTLSQDQRHLISCNWRRHELFAEPQTIQLHDPEAESFAALYAAHTSRLAELELQAHLPLDPEAWCLAQQRLHQESFDAAHEQGLLVPAEGGMAVRPGAILSYAKGLLRAAKRTTKQWQKMREQGSDLTCDPETAPIESQVIVTRHLRALLDTPVPRAMFKGLMLASALLFLLVFSLLFSWQSGLLILATVALHESGHALAMRWVGYQRITMIFLPPFGAVVSGDPAASRPWQQIFVYLMGPLPGILLGALLYLIYWPNISELVNEFALTLLVLNYINLLPLVPLDGGQILRIALFNRSPLLQVLFIGFSGCGLLAVGASFSDPLMLVLGIFLLLGLSGVWREGRLAQSIRPGWNNDQPLSLRLGRLYHAVATHYPKEPFATREGLVRALAQRLASPVSGWKTATAGGMLYLALVIAPLFPSLIFLLNNADYPDAYLATLDRAGWDELVESAEDNEERLDLCIKATDNLLWREQPNPQDLHHFYQCAYQAVGELPHKAEQTPEILAGLAASATDQESRNTQLARLERWHAGDQEAFVVSITDFISSAEILGTLSPSDRRTWLLHQLNTARQTTNSALQLRVMRNLANDYIRMSESAPLDALIAEAQALLREQHQPEDENRSLTIPYTAMATTVAQQWMDEGKLDQAHELLKTLLPLWPAEPESFARVRLYEELVWLELLRGDQAHALSLLDLADAELPTPTEDAAEYEFYPHKRLAMLRGVADKTSVAANAQPPLSLDEFYGGDEEEEGPAIYRHMQWRLAALREAWPTAAEGAE